MQGFGQFSAALVGLIITFAFRSAILNDAVGAPNSVDYCWRLLIGRASGLLPVPR